MSTILALCVCGMCVFMRCVSMSVQVHMEMCEPVWRMKIHVEYFAASFFLLGIETRSLIEFGAC